ncbi:hypothetical protein V2J09_010899 [Rumex salicifolius]
MGGFMVLVMLFSWAFYMPFTHQLQSYQTQVLLQLRKHLEYPTQLQRWENYTGDICIMTMTPTVKVSCEANSVTELRIAGDRNPQTSRRTNFSGYAIPGLTLSQSFSIDSFITTLTRLPDLKAVSLVSLGIWGPLPDKIHRLRSLELLDISANFLYGNIPPEISVMSSLRSLTLDSNFFNDTIPDWWDSLTTLSVLSFKDNLLQGSFPSSICHIANLTDLSLSGNNLSGELPDLGRLYSLHLLDLRHNQFSSELPTMPNSLVTLLLSRNSFTGAVSEKFDELLQLQHLDLSYNLLSGSPPLTLFSLPNLSYLNLASNVLSGSFSDELNCGNELGFVDISNNRLTGGLPSCLETTSGKRIVKYGGNCLSAGAQKQHQLKAHLAEILLWDKKGVLYCGDSGHRCTAMSKKTEHNIFPRIIQQNGQIGLSADLLANARLISQAAKAGSQGTPAYRVYSLEELEDATNGFNVSTFLGQGSTGKIYKGNLRSGTDVAIRSLCLYGKQSSQKLKSRLDQLSKLRHPHLVALLGHCLDGYGRDQCNTSRIFLVYEYVSNGSFHSHLSESCPQRVLTWSNRLAILNDVAKAVHFLHTAIFPGSFRNQLRANNILLDENGVAKLSDYGISLITDEAKGDGSKSWYIFQPTHTKPVKMDSLEDEVYNFGFILLEALVGPRVAGNGDALLLSGMTSFDSQDGGRMIVDPIVLSSSSSQEALARVISITNKCILAEACARPSFEDVLWNLQYAAQLQSAADPKSSDTASWLSNAGRQSSESRGQVCEFLRASGRRHSGTELSTECARRLLCCFNPKQSIILGAIVVQFSTQLGFIS